MKFLRAKLATPLLLALAVAYGLPARASEYDDVDRLTQAGKLDDAMTRADQFLAGNPRDPQMRFLKGVIQIDAGKNADAIATFTRLTQDMPELPEPYNNLAVLYAGQGQYDKARAVLESAIKTNPSYSTAHENLGDVYARMASQAYSKALQLDQGNTAVGPKLAVIRQLIVPTSTAATSVARGQKDRGTVVAAATPVAPPPAPTPAPAPVPARPTAPPPPPPPPAPPPAPAPAPAPAAKPAPAAPPVVSALPAAPTTPPKPSAEPVRPVTPPTAPATPVTPVAPPAAAPAPAAVAQKPAANPATGNAEVESAVRAWAGAWAAQDMDGYLRAYGSDFKPAGGQSRKAWEEERRARIVGKSNISVSVQNLVVSVDGDTATARFRQSYRADSLNVNSRKTLELVRHQGQWRIRKEAVGG